MIDTKYRKFVQRPIDKFASYLHKLNIRPNTVSFVALILGLLAAITYVLDFSIILAVTLLWISGFLDVVDGTLARIGKNGGKFGTVLDIVFDRIVEGAMILALVLRNEELSFLMICLLFSILISITIFLTVGATAQNNGIKLFKYQAGLAERTEGFIMFTLIMIFTDYQWHFTLIFIIIIIITIIQRFYEAYIILERND